MSDPMLIRHSFFYLLARGVPGTVNFAALALYTHLLGTDDFGRYSLVLAGVGLVHVIVFQWLLLVVGRFLPAHLDEPKAVLQPVLALFLLLAGGGASIGLVVAVFCLPPPWSLLVTLAVVLTIAQAWHELNLSVATAQLAPGRYGALSGIKAVFALLLAAYLAWLGWGGYAPIVGLATGSLAAWFLFGRGIWFGIQPQWPSSPTLKDYRSYGLPLALTFALVWITSSSDRLVIAWLLDEAATGIYTVGYDLAQQSLGLLLTIVNTAALPLAIRKLERDGPQAASEQMQQNGQLTFAIAFSGAAGLIAVGPALMEVFVGSAFREGALSVFSWVAIVAAVVGIKSFHFDIAFHLTKQSKWLLITSGLAAIANLLLNIVLIPRFGIVGAAWAGLAAYSVATVSSAVLGRRVFPMPAVMPLLWYGVMPAAMAYLGGWLVMQTGIATLPKLILAVLAGSCLTMVAALALNVAGMRQALWQHLLRWRRQETRSSDRTTR